MFFYIPEMLTADEEEFLALHSADTVKRLMSVTEAKGLRNSDLVSLTRWAASKISKLINNKQKLSPEDLKTWAMCLGYTPRIFLDENFDLRNFNLSENVRNLLECLNDLITHHGKPIDEMVVNDVLRYELPLSIINVLQLESTDYMVEGRILYKTPGVYETPEEIGKDEGIVINLQHRNVQLKNDSHFFIQCRLSPDRSALIFGVFMTYPQEHLLPAVRAQNKELLLINDNATKTFDEYARKHRDWIPNWMRGGEIYSSIFDTGKLPDEHTLESALHAVYDKYCDLVYAKSNGVDIKGRNKDQSAVDMYRMLTGEIGFAPETTQKILMSRNYQCEVDPGHESFVDDDGDQYMEVIPLIPFKYAMNLGQGLQSEANGLCLCPMCAAKYKHGRNQERAQMVFALFGQHEEALKNNGIHIAISQALGFNGL